MVRLLTIGLAVIGTVAACASVYAQGTRCSAFLHERDGSWRSFVDDEMLLPRGPMPIHAGQRFSRESFVARLLDAQCQPGGPLY